MSNLYRNSTYSYLERQDFNYRWNGPRIAAYVFVVDAVAGYQQALYSPVQVQFLL